ncbi:hypothetical protein C8R44DRAFT_893867 [Mycena epipterygia]|nr:hypothetical protein C8R44DRAFT_893867 [Mycena epipterygia]
MAASLDGTLGAFEIGIVAGTFLFGIATLQTFNYYGDASQDSINLKSLVALLWILDLGHTISSLHGIYSLTGTFYGQRPINILLKPPQSLPLTLLFSGAIVASVQIFFGNRIRVLSGPPHIFSLCIALAIIRLACDVLLMSDFWIYNAGFSVLQSKEHWEVIVSCTVSPVGDIVVAVSMSYCLWQLRKSEFNRTRSMADTRIIWTCGGSETTLVTSVAVMLQLILFLTRRDFGTVTVGPGRMLHALVATPIPMNVWRFARSEHKLVSTVLPLLNGMVDFRALGDLKPRNLLEIFGTVHLRRLAMDLSEITDPVNLTLPCFSSITHLDVFDETIAGHESSQHLANGGPHVYGHSASGQLMVEVVRTYRQAYCRETALSDPHFVVLFVNGYADQCSRR